MDETMLAKRLSRYESGLITAPEWANALLHELVAEPELDTTSLASLDLLPHEVGQEFRRLMARIEEADFRWTPFFLTSATGPRHPAEFSDQLRRVSASLKQGGVNGGAVQPAGPGGRPAVGAATMSAVAAKPD